MNWTDPRVAATLAAGDRVILVDKSVRPGVGFITELGTSWVSAGPNGDKFYYLWYVDGYLTEKILRVVGNAISGSSGVSSPFRFVPPLQVRRDVRIIAVNEDTSSHSAEVYLGGYTIYAEPAISEFFVPPADES